MRSQSHAFSKSQESREVEPGSIARLIDHTLLSPFATYGEIKTLCEEALRYGFFSVCVNPFFIKAAKDILKDNSVKVTTVKLLDISRRSFVSSSVIPAKAVIQSSHIVNV